jgi:hypothetical protein
MRVLAVRLTKKRMNKAMVIPLLAASVISVGPLMSVSAQCEYTIGGTAYTDCEDPITTGEQGVEVCVECDGGFNECTSTSGGWGGWLVVGVPCGDCTVTLEKGGLGFCYVSGVCPPDPCVHPIDIIVDADHEEENMSLGFYVIEVCEITGCDPPDCAVDARQPHHLYDSTDKYGWDYIDLTFECDPPDLGPQDFVVTQIPNALPAPPAVESVTNMGGNTVRVQLRKPINPENWTCFALAADPDEGVCLGYLPGDCDQDGTSAPADILCVIDCINEVRPCEPWHCNMDRDVECGPPDILRVIDLLNGAGEFEPWLDVSVPPCPSGE